MNKTALVTVGTTSFDNLIRQIDTVDVLTALQQTGFGTLIVQTGKSQYIPTYLRNGTISLNSQLRIEVEMIEYHPSLVTLMRECDLVISHAGSGSIFESLQLGLRLLVVPNPRLMHNHQIELAERLEKDNYLVSSSLKDLANSIVKVQNTALDQYQPSDLQPIVKHIRQFLEIK